VAPLCIFPEGACNNGLYLNKFRKGAFNAERAIRPFISNFEWDTVSVGYDSLNALHQVPLLFSQITWLKASLNVFPIF
jgi:hypothetical protein